MLFVKCNLYQSILVLRFFSQQKNQQHFCLVGRSCSFLRRLHFNGDRESHSLDPRSAFLQSVESFPQWRRLWGVFRAGCQWFQAAAPSRVAEPTWSSTWSRLGCFWVCHSVSTSSSNLMGWALSKRRRGLSVCLSICFSLSLPCHEECEWCRRSSKALGPTSSLESNHQLWRSTDDDAVLDKMPKHQHLHPVRNPRTLCRARSCVACSCSYCSFPFAHHWGVWMCWAPATITDISSVTTKFTITWVRWGPRRASGVTRMYLHTVTQLCQKTEVCKIFVKR